jgi:2-polyprenyl-6-methoxyphenol hydroxylase-like FAD-dependent oxidoreductase
MTRAPSRLDVAILGAGFAGLAAAALLARSGHRVTVIEKFSEPKSIGAGVLVQPVGLAAMKVLGIDAGVLRHGARIDRLLGRSHRGGRVVDIRYDRWKAGSFGVGLHRGVLFDALWNQAQRNGAQMITGKEVRNLEAIHARFDLAVVADGCRSSLRCQTGLASTDHVYPWGAVWAVLRDPQRRYGSTLHQWYRNAGQMLGIMPTGLAPGTHTNVVSLFWSLRADRLGAWLEAGLESFKRDVLALHKEAGPLLDQITSIEQLTWARYHDVVMPAYHTDRCVVIGDAAHATSPQLGQGTNLALVDAVTLNDCIDRHATLPAALAAYTAARRQHLHFTGEASRWLTPLFQSDLRLLPWLRDMTLAVGSRLPFAGPLALETLVGVRQAWWRGDALPMPSSRPVAAAPLRSAGA